MHKKVKTHCKTCDGRALCKSSWCETAASNKSYEGYCLHCFQHLFPDRPVARNYKTKEAAVVEAVREAFPAVSWVADKRVADGCSARRPDLLLDLGTHVLVVEVDENQHTAYDCSCENKRLMELSRDIGHRPLVFIRFNPDGYKDAAGATVRTCWKLGKDGVVRIASAAAWSARLTALLDQIRYWVEHPTEKMVEVVQLFFDEL